MAVVFLLITVWMVAVYECAISKNNADHIAPALTLPLNARDSGETGLGNCNPFRRSTIFHIDVASHRSRLKELHVRHNLKGLVEMEDSDRDGHLVTVDVKSDASSESELSRVFIIHRIVESSEMKSILLVQADVRTIYVGNTFSMFFWINLAAGALLVMLLIGAVWTCHKRCRPLQEASGRGPEPGGNMLALTGLQSQGPFGFHLTSQTSLEVQSTSPGNDIRQLTVPLASSAGHAQPSRGLRLTAEEVPNFMETSFDVDESHPDNIRPSYHFHGSIDSRPTSSPSTILSRRVETASILTVMVVALAMSVHTMCVDDDINVHIIIKLPRSLLLEDVKIFYNVKYNNDVEIRAWSRNSSILHIFDLPSAPTTDNSPCNETLLCGSGQHSSHLSGATSMACDWSTRSCVCQRGSVMINGVCTSPPPAEADLDSDAELLDSSQVTAVASANLLLENLHNARNLETTYYVTDTKQLTDFFWYRDSGIRVNVGLQNIDVIPTYEDVDHEGDGDFMMQNPSGKAELEYFRGIQLNRCRYPMPDYYSLTLEIAKDRTTKASMEVCTMQEYSAGRCPQGVHIGDSYVRRMLNEPCHKMGAYPEPLQPAANSIVCTDSTHLLTAVFNITPAAVHPIPLVSDACRVAGNQCAQCLSQPRCQLSDELDRGCCLLDCYTRPECKLATGAYCRNPPLECAQGDSYRYTLQPVYQDLRNSYQCHIRRKSPEVLYELWFYVSIPSSNFETPRLYTAIQLSKTDRHVSRGQHQHEFLTVEYSYDIDLEEDLILKGLQQEPGLWNHTVHPLGRSSDKFPLVGTLRELSKNVFIASVNFDEPFAFSSSTWVVGDGCQKNVSKFVPPPSQSDASQQAVTVSTNNLLGQPFKYLIKAANSPPSMRVLIPGNISLLRWWFRDKPPFLITGNSLRASLTFNGTSLMVNIQGFLTGCPGYLGILVNNLHGMREVVKYDILVSCPQQFSVTFNVADRDPFMDQALEVLIDDAKHISQLLLIYSPTEQRRRQKIRVTEDRSAALFVTIGLLNLLFAAALTFVFLSALFWACTKSLWLICQRIVRRNSGKLSVKQDVRLPVSDQNNSRYCTSTPRHLTFKTMNAHQRILVILYIFWKILYIIFCTFTVFFLLLNAFIGPKAAEISETVDQLQTRNAKKSDLYQQTLEEQIEIELIQQSEFLEKIYRDEMFCLEELLNRTRVRLENLTETLSTKSVLGNKLKNRLSFYHKKTDNFTEYYRKKFDDDLYPLVNRYRSYINVLSRNPWFLFPRRLFNSTLELSKVMTSVGRSTANSSTEARYRFWDFLGVQEVDQVQQWTKSVWNNYFGMMSLAIDLHTLPDARDNSCEERTSTKSKPWNQTLALVNSTRFFNSLRQREIPNRKTDPLSSFDIYSDIQVYSHHNSPSDVDSLRQNLDLVNLVEHLHIEFIRIIFFCVDIILLFHRCAHLYRCTQSMFTGFKCRTVLGHSQFWRLRLATELNGGVGMTTHPLKTKQQNHLSSSSSSVRSPPNESKCMSDGILLVTRPTSDLTPPTASCNNLLPVGHDSSCYSEQARSNASCSAISVDDLKSSQSVFCYFNVVLQSSLLRRLGLAILVVLLLYLLLTSVNCILLSFSGCYPQMAALYQDLVDVSDLLSVTSWQHLVQLAYWYKSREISEFHFSISSLQSFVEEQEEMKRRNFLDQVCYLFADGADKSCVSSNETDGWVHDDDDVNARITFPCPYNYNRSHFHTQSELNISCTKNLAVLVLSTRDVIADAWHVLLASVLLIVVLHALGTVMLHFVKKCKVFPIRYICETSSSSTISPSSSASRVNRSIASSYSAEKSEAVSCKLELPAVYRIISSTTPETSPSSQSNFAGMSRRSRVRFAPTVQVSSANSSFGSIPTQMQMEIGYAESNV